MAEGRKIDIEHLAKMAYDEDRQLRLPMCGKLEYAGLMCKWEDIGPYNQDIWRAIIIRILDEITINHLMRSDVGVDPICPRCGKTMERIGSGITSPGQLVCPCCLTYTVFSD